MLFDRERRGRIASLKQKCRVVNMALAPEFEDAFFENLFLRPIRTA